MPMFIAGKVNFDESRIKIIRDISPIDLMTNASMIILTDSTMIYDAMMLNKEIIAIKIKKPGYPDPFKSAPIHMVYNQKQLEEAIRKCL